jgi:hypothetical protein
MLSCESEQLSHDFLTLVIDRTQGLKNHRAKEIVGAFETLIVLPVLLNCSVVLTRAHKPHTSLRKWLVTGKTVVVLPVRNRHVARPSTIGGANNALILENWLQVTI